MTLTEAIFLLFAGVTLVGAVYLALSLQLIRAAFWLFVVLLGTGALYAFVGADVLTMSQIVVYVGGVLVLIVFGVMLTRQKVSGGQQLARVVPALLVLAALGVGLHRLIVSFPVEDISWEVTSDSALSNVETIGRETMTHWVVPFEAVSVLLLMALVGAAYLARPDGDKKKPRRETGQEEKQTDKF